jgi:hypothetical protein
MAGKGKPRRSDHARKRAGQGRPVGQAIADARQATLQDVFVQIDDDRLVVRGPQGREHVFEPDVQDLVTSLIRSAAAHSFRLSRGTIRQATDVEYARFQEAVHDRP